MGAAGAPHAGLCSPPSPISSPQALLLRVCPGCQQLHGPAGGPTEFPPRSETPGGLLHPGAGERNPVPALSQVGGWAGVPGMPVSCQLLCLVRLGSLGGLGGTTRPVCTRAAVGPGLPLPMQPGAGNSLSHPLQLAGRGRWPGPPRLQDALANYRQAEISSSNIPASARLPTRRESQRQFNEGPG